MTVLVVPEASDVASYSDPGAMVLALVEQGRQLLSQARTIEEHVALNHRADAVASLTTQLGLSKELVNEAKLFERQTERALEQATRAAQDRDEIASRRNAVQVRYRPEATSGSNHQVGPKTLAEVGIDKSMLAEIRPLGTASEQQFDQAVEDAKAEGDLSRANVIRKIKGETKPKPDRPEVLKKTRRLDSNRIVSGAIESIAGIDSLFDQIDYESLDGDLLLPWVSSLSGAIRSLTTLKNNLKKELTRGRA